MNNNLKKLEFDKILEAISNYCKTYIGKKYVGELRPSQDPEEVQHMLNETSQGVILIQRNSTPPLGSIADITVYLKTLDGCGALSIKALLELQNILQMSASLKDYFTKDYLETSDCFLHLLKYLRNNAYPHHQEIYLLMRLIADRNFHIHHQ